MAVSNAVFAVSAFLILVSRSDFLPVLVSILLSRLFLDVAELVILPSRAGFAFSEFDMDCSNAVFAVLAALFSSVILSDVCLLIWSSATLSFSVM